ncbi:MAG: DEAD/DEAH box helicase [Lachnospiraceae bacterium]|nr:DEAD/DEAH box helicase [Lachnospiraceae bacterium]
MKHLNNALLPHQTAAVEKLIKLKVGALFAEQGTGKTITTLEIARRRVESDKISHIIWLCPCSAKQNIRREIVKQSPDELCSMITICGIETLSTSIRAMSYLLELCQNKRCFLVVDESLLIKNPWAYRTKNILQLAEKCQYRIILNGTPVSRNEADLFSQFYLLDWRILGYKSYWSFAANHLEYDEYGNLRRVLNKDALADKIAPYTYQITKSECMELPCKHYKTYYFNLTEEQNIEYGEAARYLLDDINEWKPETIYRLFSGLQAVISGKRLVFNRKGTHFDTAEFFRNPMDNPRLRMLLDCLDDEKTIIFCHYESEISQLCTLLPEAVRFDGKVSLKKRDDALIKFSRDKKYLIANKNCAGYSLNLQFCHRIIYMSNDWDLGTRLQSEDRIHRYGQEHNVEIIDICAENTIDEQIIRCLRNKEYLLDSLKDKIKDKQNIKESLLEYVHGAKKDIFDCDELGRSNKDAKNIPRYKCI